MVLNPTQKTQGKGKQLDDLASEFGSDAHSIRENEGEAASYGVYFDDSEYDYMQHMRDLGQNAGGDAVFVEAESANNNKGKQKQSLEDALKDMDLEQGSQADLSEEMLPSQNLTRLSYEAQQDVPDAIAGFQPDMDPRLREALEALEDDAYIDEEGDDDIFKSLTRDGEEIDDYDFEEAQYYDDEQGYESDDTAKPTREYNDDVPQLVSAPGEQPDEGPSQDWMAEFKKFKQEEKAGRAAPPQDPSQADMKTTWTTTTNGGMKKKRKGALTDASNYSMTSSSLVRTDQMDLLDQRFDKLEERYNEDMDDMASVSQVSGMSSVEGPMRKDFDGILDDFLGNYTKPGKRTNKKTKAQTGLQQLEEIRQGLGPARFRTPARKSTSKAASGAKA